ELVDPGRALAPGQIYNSNQPLINGLLAALGCQVVAVRHVADTPEATRQALEAAAAEADVIVSTGGVSVGEADYVKDAVEALGRLDLWKIAVKPGKPLAFGRVGDAVFVGLPGNPVSALVTFSLFGAPVIRKMQGRSDTMPEAVRVPAGFAAPAPKREEYLRVRLQHGRLERYPHQGSGVLSSAVWADGLARLAVGQAVAEGDPVDYLGFERLLY
ncbi:MAG TPA: molybdopterin molybdotransferase MoeA, partial [Wenzhouxiangella sp.]|nr:molybdopterin molybdotransferase MoeA [Wenzhouxiangella sp.]